MQHNNTKNNQNNTQTSLTNNGANMHHINTSLFNQTTIGKSATTDCPLGYNHHSQCYGVAWESIMNSQWVQTITEAERKDIDLNKVNYDYYERGYQLYKTHRGAYVLVPKGFNEDVILFTPKEYTPTKPKAPSSMVCDSKLCNRGWIAWNGSSYPCSTCDDIVKYKRDLKAYNEQVSQKA
jgi:hypothetical protein